MLLNRKYWHEAVTEVVRLNTTEIWEFVNLTEDTHPMHLHLVRFQILNRQVFDRFEYLMHRRMRYHGGSGITGRARAGLEGCGAMPGRGGHADYDPL